MFDHAFYNRAVARLTRRQLLRAGSALGFSSLVLPSVSTRVWAQPVFRHYPFTLGVASGDPLPDGVVLWTRLAPEPLDGGGMPMQPVEVDWAIATDDGLEDVVQSGTALAAPELGHSVHVEVEGLEPGREYWYRFTVGREESEVGRTRTAPAAGTPVDRIRFGLCGCNHYESGYFTAFRHMANEAFDVVFHTGDYIYEYRDDGGEHTDRVRQHAGDEIYTIVDYRNRYAQYKSDPDFRAAHASAPFVVSWDDHEIDNNWATDRDQDGTPPELFILRRAAAFQAYYENQPLRRLSLPTLDHLQLYRNLAFGDLITMAVLDTRQYRSDQACDDGSHIGCEERLDPARTLLGDAQHQWLRERLNENQARWMVLAQQVPIFMRDFAPGPERELSMDKWDGYVASRERLNTDLEEARQTAPNVVALSGDVHTHWAADLKADYEDPNSATLGVEFTNSSITSGGNGSEVRSYWEEIRGDNPHIKYHSNRRGYVAHTVTPDNWTADFMVLDYVTEPGAEIRRGGSFVVEAGRPAVEQA